MSAHVRADWAQIVANLIDGRPHKLRQYLPASYLCDLLDLGSQLAHARVPFSRYPLNRWLRLQWLRAKYSAQTWLYAGAAVFVFFAALHVVDSTKSTMVVMTRADYEKAIADARIDAAREAFTATAEVDTTIHPPASCFMNWTANPRKKS